MNFTNDRAFLDTNILLYAFDKKDEKKRKIAHELLAAAFDRDYWISAQVLHEFFVNVTRKVAPPLSHDEAAKRIFDLSFMNHVDNRVEDIPRTVKLMDRYKIGFWDALIIHAASRAECKILYTEDLASGSVIERIRIENPFLG